MVPSDVSFFRVCEDAVNMAAYAARWLLQMKRLNCSGTVKVIIKWWPGSRKKKNLTLL